MAGLKIVAPATPADARGLLLSAFDAGSPVLYVEHKFLYRSALDMPVPFSKKLEAIYSPQGRLIPAIREVLAY